VSDTPEHVRRLLDHLDGVRATPNGWDARCPAHDDSVPSLGVALGDGGKILLRCRSQDCPHDRIVRAVGLTLKDLFPPDPSGQNGKRELVAAYDYRDELGAVLYQVVRFRPKAFRQRRPVGMGAWVWHLQGVRRVPYRLPELLAAPPGAPVWVVEGEKDADRLARLGLVATTNAQGAGKWKTLDRDTVGRALGGRPVVILPDQDEPGREHALQVAAAVAGVAASVRVLELPGLPPKGDVSDWLAANRPDDPAAALRALADLAPAWSPGPAAPGRNGHADRPVPERCRAEATKKIRPLAPFRPFPVDVLPPPLARFVHEGAAAIGCDTVYLALPVLAAVASAIGNARTIRLKREWEEPSVLWAAVVGDSGTLKSPAWHMALRRFFRLQGMMLRLLEEEEGRYAQELEEYRKAKRRAEKYGGSPGEPPLRPARKRIVTADITPEKLAGILAENPRGLLVARDELAGWLASFTRYKSSAAGSDLPFWLETHRAGTIIVDRKTGERPTLFVPRAAVSVVGGIQPGVLNKALTAEFLDAGLAARLLMAMPPRLPKKWSDRELDPATERAYESVLDKLLALDGIDQDGELKPQVLDLSPEGKAAWVSFYDQWSEEQAAAEGELAAAFSKLEAYAARFALIHHVVAHVYVDANDLRPVGRASVEAGTVLCRWFADEARRLYSSLAETTGERDDRRLLEFVQARGGSITTRELQRSNNRKYPNAEAAEAALEGLVEAGVGKWIDRPTTARGGHPTRSLHLCCTTHDRTTEPDGGREPGEDDGDDSPAQAADATPRPARFPGKS
jgi:hypothetical protein